MPNVRVWKETYDYLVHIDFHTFNMWYEMSENADQPNGVCITLAECAPQHLNQVTEVPIGIVRQILRLIPSQPECVKFYCPVCKKFRMP